MDVDRPGAGTLDRDTERHPAALIDHRFDRAAVLHGQLKAEDIEILRHMSGIARSGNRQHAAFQGIAEDHLGRRLAVTTGQILHIGVVQHLPVRCQQREPLIDNAIGGAEIAHVTVPVPRRVATDLGEARFEPGNLFVHLQLFQRDITDPDMPDHARVVQGLHRLPGVKISGGEPFSHRRPVQDKTVDLAHPQMFPRGCKGLLDLFTHRRLWVIRQSLVLPAKMGELGLDEDILAGDQPLVYRVSNPLAHGCFEIMLTLVRRIDAAKPLFQRHLGEPAGTVFLPGGPVQERRVFGQFGARATSIGGFPGIVIPTLQLMEQPHLDSRNHVSDIPVPVR